MTLGEVKEILYNAVAKFHPNAMIVWEKTKGVTPKPPYITLGYSNLSRSQFPLMDEDGEHRYYNYSFGFEINLYTVGKKVETDTGSYYENTAVEDLEDFIRFLESDGMSDELSENDVTIILNPPIRDLSELIGDTKFNYRAMAEFTVTYAGNADGKYGVSNDTLIPNSSGGGKEEFAEVETYAIEEVIIKEETDDGN